MFEYFRLFEKVKYLIGPALRRFVSFSKAKKHVTFYKVLAILEGLRLFSSRYGGSLVMENDSSNVIASVSNQKAIPWKFQFHFNEIRELSAVINVTFHHEVRFANSMVDWLAKQGVDRLVPWVGVILYLGLIVVRLSCTFSIPFWFSLYFVFV